MNQLEIRYYAILREAAGKASEQITSGAPTPVALYQELATRHGFTLAPAHLKVSINNIISPWNHPLKNNDRVAFMPPFSGG